MRLQLKQTVDSSLNSIRNLLNQHYPLIGSEQVSSSQKKTKADQRDGQRSSNDEGDQEDMETSASAADIVAPEDERNEGENVADKSSVTAVVTVHKAATQTLDFLTPFLEELHSKHTSKV